jgi:hypothetical protein
MDSMLLKYSTIIAYFFIKVNSNPRVPRVTPKVNPFVLLLGVQ